MCPRRSIASAHACFGREIRGPLRHLRRRAQGDEPTDSGTRRYTAAEAAVEIDCSAWFIKKIARENGIGYNLRGPKGLPVP